MKNYSFVNAEMNSICASHLCNSLIHLFSINRLIFFSKWQAKHNTAMFHTNHTMSLFVLSDLLINIPKKMTSI